MKLIKLGIKKIDKFNHYKTNIIFQIKSIMENKEVCMGDPFCKFSIKKSTEDFIYFDTEKFKEKLTLMGYTSAGEEYLYNGHTGKKVKHFIYVGPTYCQKLNQHIENDENIQPIENDENDKNDENIQPNENDENIMMRINI